MSLDTPLKITLHLDGAGVAFDPAEPLHLDGLLAALLVRWHLDGEPPARDEIPDNIPLPCQRWTLGGAWGWRCSAFAPEGMTAEALVYWRKRFRQGRADMLPSAAPNLEHHTYRAWQTPVPLMLCRQLIAYAVGDRRAIRRALKECHAIGKKRAHGHGRVVAIDVDPAEADWSLTRDGLAMRWLPTPDGGRLVRPRPPYWSLVARVPSCEVGDRWPR